MCFFWVFFLQNGIFFLNTPISSLKLLRLNKHCLTKLNLPPARLTQLLHVDLQRVLEQLVLGAHARLQHHALGGRLHRLMLVGSCSRLLNGCSLLLDHGFVGFEAAADVRVVTLE